MKKFITTISYNNHIDTYGADVAALPKITSEELPYTSSTHNSAMLFADVQHRKRIHLPGCRHTRIHSSGYR